MRTRQTRDNILSVLTLATLVFALGACTTEEGTTPTCVNDVPRAGDAVDNGCNRVALCVDEANVAQPATTCCEGLLEFDYDLCLYGYGAGPFPTGSGGASAASGTGGNTAGAGGGGGG